MQFQEICAAVARSLTDSWNEDGGALDAVGLQKRAIIGYEEEKSAILRQIEAVLEGLALPGGDNTDGGSKAHPPWYPSLAEAVFHEVWGLAGIAEWFGEGYRSSSSAKIIGERIYFLEDGRMRRMPQDIRKERREQLVRALLLRAPEERLDRDFHEVYMLDGTRVTIFREGLAKQGQDVIIFRRYTVPSYTFEEQAARGTIPAEAIPLFESMVRCGFNVAFCGSVRSAKTTFLSTWQSYEDPALEGVMVETDPEIPLHRLMPGAPVVQLLADGEKLKNIARNLMRSDADYFILAEARDGIALDTAVRIARRGTRRMKMTFHTRDAKTFAQDAAVEIVRSLGGDIRETALRVAGSFDYIFPFAHLRGRNPKKLRTIFEICATQQEITTRELCRYDATTDTWQWTHHISEEKRRIAIEEDAEALRTMEAQLQRLRQGSPAPAPASNPAPKSAPTPAPTSKSAPAPAPASTSAPAPAPTPAQPTPGRKDAPAC
ncbi:MAG: CpaF/VirB11 family protein [Clostridiales Family XIII bacterium]|jgi:pilus assembly protein CpaF|nr:CpaF/VirB11 family protein [Clostridiales Family XIII bacterium]